MEVGLEAAGGGSGRGVDVRPNQPMIKMIVHGKGIKSWVWKESLSVCSP